MDIRTKLDVADVDGYDWNWMAKYGDEFADELAKAFTVSFIVEAPAVSTPMVQQIAGEWARVRAGEMIQNITEETRRAVRSIVSQGVQSGDELENMVAAIRGDHVFSGSRAMNIARTETATALGQGQKGAAISQGRNEKRWVTSGSDDICQENENAGWIPMADVFPSGDDTVPQHPNCRCNVTYRTKELVENSLQAHPEFRCVGCNRLLGMDVFSGTRIVCRHCKAERVA